MNDFHYYSNYANSRDIDCFFRVGKYAFHFASNGQIIPSFITHDKNIAIQDAVYAKLENATGEVEVRRDTIRALIQKEIGRNQIEANEKLDERSNIDRMVEDYATSFVEMASMGFISMDLDEEGVFHIIAFPKGQILEDEIMNKLPEVIEGEIRIEWWCEWAEDIT